MLNRMKGALFGTASQMSEDDLAEYERLFFAEEKVLAGFKIDKNTNPGYLYLYESSAHPRGCSRDYRQETGVPEHPVQQDLSVQRRVRWALRHGRGVENLD